jgi:hypothetical protein
MGDSNSGRRSAVTVFTNYNYSYSAGYSNHKSSCTVTDCIYLINISCITLSCFLFSTLYLYLFSSSSSSSSFQVLSILRPVMGFTKLNPSIFSKVFLNFYSLLVGILESFLGSCQSSSCQHALSKFSYTDIWILLFMRFVILLKCLYFFCGLISSSYCPCFASIRRYRSS